MDLNVQVLHFIAGHLADCMRQMGYELCLADTNLWMKLEVRPDDGYEYYSYTLCYVYEILCIQYDTMGFLAKLDKYFKLKLTSIVD